MGTGIEFRCKKCGFKTNIYMGIGFRYRDVYEQTVARIRIGEYGEKWKKEFVKLPGAVVNAERELYVCASCGHFEEDLNLSIYRKKSAEDVSRPYKGLVRVSNIDPPVGWDDDIPMPHRLQEYYRIEKIYVHHCPECGKRMHRYKEDDRLKCPECREGTMEPAGFICWD